MFPLTPTLSQKRRGSRPCQYQERKPTGPIFLTEPPPESHVPPHPSPLPKEERGPTVPISGEEADRAHFLWGSLSPQKAACSPSPQPSHQRGEGAERANSRRGSRPCPFFCRDPTAHREVACSPSPQPSPQRGEGADRANIRRGRRSVPLLKQPL